MSMGFEAPLEGSTKTGAPIAICNALAPTMRALSKRVSLGGPTQILESSVVMLELSGSFRTHTHAAWRSLRWHCGAFHLTRGDYVVDF